MFYFSYNWVKELYKDKLPLDQLIELLNLQGFEVKDVKNFEKDKVITIEVKANRPDMLCHLGIVREVCGFYAKPIRTTQTPNLGLNHNKEKFKMKINVEDDKKCRRFATVIIKNVNANCSTPEYIKKKLLAIGIDPVNIVIDILNYIMLEIGQPLQAYDIDKIHGKELNVCLLKEMHSFRPRCGAEKILKSKSLVIADKEKILAIAGIIESMYAAVDKTSTNILLGSANFDEVTIRLLSKALKFSTPSSFRFERGVNINGALDALNIAAKMILDVCGGQLEPICFDFYPEKKTENIQALSITRTNHIIGFNISKKQCSEILKKYNFDCEDDPNDTDIIYVHCPDYRLDLIREIDIVEEVARIYGYHNIEPTMPIIKTIYKKNEPWENANLLRNILVGSGFYECINYSFITNLYNDIFSISPNSKFYANVKLQNPISQFYSVMRTSLIYSLLQTTIYNITKGNENLAIFEIGRTYFEDKNYDTGFREDDVVGIMFSGVRIKRGWGVLADIKYNYYDLNNYLSIILHEFGMDYQLERQNICFFEEGSGVKIFSKGIEIGFFGRVNKNAILKMPNGKLVTNQLFYIELEVKKLKVNKKTIKIGSKYPPIVREYNFLIDKNILIANVSAQIKKQSNLIKNIVIRDIYTGKGVPNNKESVLFEVCYSSDDNSLSANTVTEIESAIFTCLAEKYNIVLKS